MRLFIIAAMSSNRVIGRQNHLPWRLPADLRRFKKLTMGDTLLVGRKTFESIGRPLPGRTTIVLTRQQDYAPADVRVAHSLKDALSQVASNTTVWIAGGQQIYEQTLSRARRLYLTLVHEEFEGDAFFPSFETSEWTLTSREDFKPDEANPHPYSFLIYERPSPRIHKSEKI